MAILEASAATITAVQDRALAMDRIRLLADTYPASVFNRRSNLVYEAVDAREGRTVEGETGHNGQGMAVKFTGPMNLSVSNVEVAGYFHDTRDYNGINAGVFTGQNIRLKHYATAHRPTSGARQIGYTLGSGVTRIAGFQAIGYRMGPTGKVDESHDHAWYVKNAATPLFVDGMVVDGGWFPFHFYNDGDMALVENALIVMGKYAVTFSGALDSTTGSSAYKTSDGNRFVNPIIGGRSGPLVQAWTSDANRPVSGNVVENPVFIPGPQGVQSGIRGVTVTGARTLDPQFTDQARGNYRLKPGSPAAGAGPRYIQQSWTPGGTTPPPPPADVVPPRLTLVTPLPDQVVSGALAYRADVTDDVAVRDVTFAIYPEGVPAERRVLIVETSAPYGETPFDTTTVPDGQWVMEVTARDTSGNQAQMTRLFLIDNVPDVPPPDPDPEDCADVRAQLAAMTAERDAIRDLRDQALDERDAARAKLTAVRAGVAQAASDFAAKLTDVLED